MINFDNLSANVSDKIIWEVVKVISSNEDIFNYIKSGEADYFGFSSEEELWQDRILFRPNRYTEFVSCIDYVYSEDGRERAVRVTYILLKLKSLFRDWEDEKILKQVRKFISTFTNL